MLHAKIPQMTPMNEIVQPLLAMSMCTILVLAFIIPPGIVQTSSEQIIHTIAAVSAEASAKLSALIFMTITSINSILRTQMPPVNSDYANGMPMVGLRIGGTFTLDRTIVREKIRAV